MKNSITDVPGILVGNAQDTRAGTGCTVILYKKGAVTGVDVRGGAPGTKDISCLNPVNLVPSAQAVYLGGGSAYGLDGAAGVMQYLEEQGCGFDVGVGVVPIVPGAVLFDLPVGRADIRPDKEMGYRACLNATDSFNSMGNTGAGTGASVGKIKGCDFCMKGGLGTASRKVGDLIVGAIVAVNCYGDVIDPSTGTIIAGVLTEKKNRFARTMSIISGPSGAGNNAFTGNTTIGCIATNAVLNKQGATKTAMMAHDGFARAINPIHTMFDGDTIFCMATGEIKSDPTTVGAIAAEVMAEAIVLGIKNAESAYGIPGFKEIQRRMK